MRVVTITEAKNGLSSLIDVVKAGETVVIVDRGRPVARLESAVVAGEDDPDGRLARLERAGIVRVSPVPPRPGLAMTGPPGPAPATSGVAALLEERREGR